MLTSTSSVVTANRNLHDTLITKCKTPEGYEITHTVDMLHLELSTCKFFQISKRQYTVDVSDLISNLPEWFFLNDKKTNKKIRSTSLNSVLICVSVYSELLEIFGAAVVFALFCFVLFFVCLFDIPMTLNQSLVSSYQL